MANNIHYLRQDSSPREYPIRMSVAGGPGRGWENDPYQFPRAPTAL